MQTKIKKYLFLVLSIGLLGLLCCGAAEAASSGKGKEKIAVSPTSTGEGYASVLYDNTSGLPTSEANAIAETSEGFIWIGSYSGLIRYDGNTFERIDSTTGISSVTRLYVDSKDRLWIGTNDNGVAVMEKGNYTLFGVEEGLGSPSIRSIVEDSDGNIYIATTQGVVVIDEDMQLREVEGDEIRNEYIRQLQVGKSGEIYGLTIEGAVFTMENGKLTSYYDGETLGITEIRSILPDEKRSGYVFLGAKQSDIHYGKLENGFEEEESMQVAPLTYINAMKQMQEKIWVCADNGIGFLENGVFQKLENIPLGNSIEQIMIDYQGNLWFTSSRQGVMKIVPSQFTDIFEQYRLPEEVVNTTCSYKNKLFIGKDTGLTVIGKNGVKEKFPLKKAVSASGKKVGEMDLIQMLDGCKIRSIIPDSKDCLWFSTFSDYGLIRYQKGSVTCFTADDGLPSNRVRTIFERKDGTIMVVCTGGLALIQDGNVTKVYGESSGIRNTEILTAVEAENGDMVLGSDGGGIYVIRDEKVTEVGRDAGLRSGIVMRIRKDITRNLFWIVTSNAIAYMDTDYNVTTIEKFPYSNNFDLYENKNGEMWVLSSNGIYEIPVEELLANEEISPVFYGKDNGLPCIATGNSYSALTEEGNLYIAGSTGVAKVNIEEPFEDVSELNMAVPYVEADGDFFYADEEGTITVPSSMKKLTIYSFVYTYSLMNPQVTYYLDGFDKKKVTVKRSELVPVDYTNLRGGTYHFIMRLKDSMGRGNKELSVRIVKRKKFYEVLWFNILCLILLALLLVEGVRLYIRQKTTALMKKNEENRKLIREIVEAFAKTIDMKDRYTNGHSFRVARYTAMLTRELGYDEETVEKYYDIALLHDIGKIGIPPEVLNKPDRLTDEEFRIMQSHAALGYDALKNISIMPELAVGAGAHHERPDGKGYPNGLTGEQIPRVAQIIAVADTFDAMYSTRPYRKRMNFEKAVSIIRDGAGTQLTSDVVDAFLSLVGKGEFRAADDTGGGTMEDIDNTGE